MRQNAMDRLMELCQEKNSRIVAGLDPTWESIPEEFKVRNGWGQEEDDDFLYVRIFQRYCEAYIDAVASVVPAIKINSAFFEKEGLDDLYWMIAVKAKDAGLFVIGDLKRADIGSTSAAYAEAYLSEDAPFDAITINPYFGTDGVKPFLELAKENGKGVFILVKTSNKSADEIQDLRLEDGRLVYEAVADLVIQWQNQFDDTDGEYSMIGAVVGATHKEQAEALRKQMPNTAFLVPGYGAQGATAEDVAVNFNEKGLGAIVNSSRGIMNAYKKECWKEEFSEEDWDEAATAEATRATEEINRALEK